jgi:hypothetical protein
MFSVEGIVAEDDGDLRDAAFYAKREFVEDHDLFEFLECRLGSPILSGRPLLQRGDWPSIFEVTPNSWADFMAQILRLIELAVVEAFQVASSAGTLQQSRCGKRRGRKKKAVLKASLCPVCDSTGVLLGDPCPLCIDDDDEDELVAQEIAGELVCPAKDALADADSVDACSTLDGAEEASTIDGMGSPAGDGSVVDEASTGEFPLNDGSDSDDFELEGFSIEADAFECLSKEVISSSPLSAEVLDSAIKEEVVSLPPLPPLPAEVLPATEDQLAVVVEIGESDLEHKVPNSGFSDGTWNVVVRKRVRDGGKCERRAAGGDRQQQHQQQQCSARAAFGTKAAVIPAAAAPTPTPAEEAHSAAAARKCMARPEPEDRCSGASSERPNKLSPFLSSPWRYTGPTAAAPEEHVYHWSAAATTGFALAPADDRVVVKNGFLHVPSLSGGQQLVRSQSLPSF